ncbi:polysaccharide biosynthesis/export family protein [Xinfangfangia sp. CPCC 101601]|uniref:Polysaccharide biosynthesis/export family protein n=1 Tax=Pseudogemmobacter lacusdianii TaxID=3069608 RepID=A0ABU0VW30_9RHOB|nr:polysaccharide biosynthesis/export family protein [Xinfangfangia sp. CPCC 101601]MDQ2065145.1 polysaccharide biosynthesis/export family protein [Xinfangfangia sp. CPCC 101601]
MLYVDRTTYARVSKWPSSGKGGMAGTGWIENKRGPSDNLINAGDRVDITIWETGEGSLLIMPGQKVVALPGLTVSADGTVFLPFADKVYIANMTVDQAREAIQAKLAVQTPATQVLINHSAGRKSTVDLISGVPRPGSYPLPSRDFTVLSLLALGGGVPAVETNPYVRLMRDGKIYSISADRLLKNPSLDTTLRGGDKVYVEPDERYFLSLGAAGREAMVRFPQDRISALDALALIGGLNESRADAKGILILRDYPAKAVRSDGKGPPKQRMIFVIDMTSADGLFSAGQFTIQAQDVVMATESKVTSANVVMGLIGGVLGLGRTSQLILDRAD